MLVNGTAPSAVAQNLVSTVILICPNAEIIELPNADYVCKARGIIRIVSKVAAAHELGKNYKWLKKF